MAEQVVRTNIVNFFKNANPSSRITTSAVSDTIPEAAKRSPADRGGDKGAGPAERAIPPEKGIRPGENRRGGAGLGRLEPAGRQTRKRTDPWKRIRQGEGPGGKRALQAEDLPGRGTDSVGDVPEGKRHQPEESPGGRPRESIRKTPPRRSARGRRHPSRPHSRSGASSPDARTGPRGSRPGDRRRKPA